MISAQQIFTRYLRFYFFSIFITVLFFCIAIQHVWLFPLLAILITYGYWRMPQYFGRRHERLLGILLIVILILCYAFSRGDLLLAAGYMLVGFCVIFFYQDSLTQASYVNLMPLLGLMVISTFLTAELLYLFFFVVTTWLYSCLLFYLFLYRLPHKSTPLLLSDLAAYQPAHLGRAGGKLCAYLGCLVFIVLGFVLLPRTAWEINLSRSASGKEEVQFAKEVESQSVSRMMLQNHIYFTVKTSLRYPYFRAAVCDHYTGNKWGSHFASGILMPVVQEGKRRFVFGEPARKGKIAQEAYTIQDYQGTPVILRGAPDRLQFESESWRITNSGLRSDTAGNIESVIPLRRGVEYILWTRDVAAQTRGEPYLATQERAQYLTLPELSPRVCELAQKLAGSSPEETAKTVEDYLKAQYPYNLDTNPGDNEWVDYFLFEARQGYCVHFATAMAVLLRLNHIPTRLVCGFFGKNYDSDRRQFVIGNEDAHAWVEVHVAGRGWLHFDPTPAQEDYLKGTAWLKRLYYDLRSWWFKNVIGFSRFQQSEIYAWIRETAKAAWRYAIYWLPPLVLLFLARRLLRWRRGYTSLARVAGKYLRLPSPQKRSGTAAAASLAFYQTMLESLRQVGIERSSCETPYEFARRAAWVCPEVGAPLQSLTGHFCTLRFGHVADAPLQPSIAHDLETLEAAVARWLEKKRLAAQAAKEA
jgi:hypothetical protein